MRLKDELTVYLAMIAVLLVAYVAVLWYNMHNGGESDIPAEALLTLIGLLATYFYKVETARARERKRKRKASKEPSESDEEA